MQIYFPSFYTNLKCMIKNKLERIKFHVTKATVAAVDSLKQIFDDSATKFGRNGSYFSFFFFCNNLTERHRKSLEVLLNHNSAAYRQDLFSIQYVYRTWTSISRLFLLLVLWLRLVENTNHWCPAHAIDATDMDTVTYTITCVNEVMFHEAHGKCVNHQIVNRFFFWEKMPT